MRQDRQLNFVVFVQAARILANLIVMGSGILGRAVFQAYRQALASMSSHCVSVWKCSVYGFLFFNNNHCNLAFMNFAVRCLKSLN